MINNALFDNDFINELLRQTEREIYIRVTVLNQKEEPIEFIEGKATGGSINVDGKSAVRRSCSLTLVAEDIYINEFYWGLKNKFKFEVGIKNNTNDKYENIIWFPQGIFLITNFDTNLSGKKWTISIKGKDKMCLLNGEFGGHLPHNTDFGKETYHDLKTDTRVDTDVPIRTIIREAVRNFGDESPNNIIINDIEDIGFELLEYRGNTPLYMFRKENDNIFTNITFNQNQTCYYWSPEGWTQTVISDNKNIIYDNLVDLQGENEPTKVKLHNKIDQLYYIAKFEYGSTPGYRLTELTYAGELISKAGETVVTLLDKIKKMLGDFEYFYNLEGKFVFQKKKKYNAFNWQGSEIDEVLYADATLNMEKPVFSFLDNKLITSFKNTPKFTDLKNDFSIWGTKKEKSGTENPIHARYAIDEKPIYYKSYDGKYYIADKTVLNELKQNIKFNIMNTIEQELIAFQLNYPIKNVKLTRPNKLEDYSWTEGWWDIRDWAAYYKIITGSLSDPLYSIKWYSQNNYNGYQVIYADNWNLYNNAYKDTYYIWLIVENKDGLWDPQYGGTTNNPQYYTNTQLCTKYESHVQNNGVIYTEIAQPYEQKEYMYPFACSDDTYTYLYFLKNHVENNGEKVYIYNPSFPDNIELLIETRIENAFNKMLNDNVIQYVDWREIIYQMSLDYNKHYHEDDFLYQIAANNPDYYPTGQTGYERYYIDINGFWRTLYDPNPTPLFEIISYLDADKYQKEESLYIQHSYRKLEMDEKDELTIDISKLYVLDKTRCDSLPNIISHPDMIPFLGSKYCKLVDDYDLYFYVNEDNVMNSGETDRVKLNKINLIDIYLKNRGPFISDESIYYINTEVNQKTFKPDKYYIKLTEEGYYLYNDRYDVSLDYYIQDSSSLTGYKQVNVKQDKYEPGLYYTLTENQIYENGEIKIEKIYTPSYTATYDPNEKYYKPYGADYSIINLNSSNYEPNKYYILRTTTDDNGNYISLDYILSTGSFNINETYYEATNLQYVYTVVGDYEYKPNEFYIYKNATYKLYSGDYQTNLTYYSIQDSRKHYYVKGPDESSGLNGESKYQYWVFKYPFGTAVGEYYDDYTNYAALQLEKYLEEYGWDNLYIKTDGHIKFQDLDLDVQRLYYKQGGMLAEYLTNPIYDNYNVMKTNKTELTKFIYDIDPNNYTTFEDFRKAILNLQMEYANATIIMDNNIINSIYLLKSTKFYNKDDYYNMLYQYYDLYLTLLYDNYPEILATQLLTYEQVHYKHGYYNFNRDSENGDYWTKTISDSPENLLFWFDFINGKTSYLSKYSVRAIGPRTKVVNDNNVKSIYYKEIPSTIFITSNEDKTKYEYQQGYNYIQLNQGMESLFVVSAKGKSAKEALDEILYTNSYATETATIQTTPIYHLQPNTCIYIRNDDTKIDGEYLISKLTIPLDHKKMMSITATKVIPNII